MSGDSGKASGGRKMSSGGSWESMLAKQWSSGCNSSQPRRCYAVLCARRCSIPGGMEALLRCSSVSSSAQPAGSCFEDAISSTSDQSSFRAPGDDVGSIYDLHNSGSALAVDPALDAHSIYNGSGSRLSTSSLLGGKAKLLASRVSRAARAGQDRLERSVTSLAIRANTSASSSQLPDFLTCVAYLSQPHPDAYPSSARNFQEIGRTEAASITLENFASSLWSIPILLPTDKVSPSSVQADRTVRFSILLRSGMVQWTGKNYTLATANISLNELLRNTNAQPSSIGKRALQLQSPVLNQNESPVLEIVVVENKKYPALGGKGWSLSDPMPDVCDGLGKQFCPPLEQLYVMKRDKSASPLPGEATGAREGDVTCQGSPPGFLSKDVDFCAKDSVLIVERTQESTVVLPVAIAVTRLLAAAAIVSANHAMSVAKEIKSASLVLDDPMHAIGTGSHADCTLEIHYFKQCGPNSAVNSSQHEIQSCLVRVALCSPECVIERDLLSSAVGSNAPGERIPVVSSLERRRIDNAHSARVAFYPRIQRNPDGTIDVGKLRLEITFEQQNQFNSNPTTARDIGGGQLISHMNGFGVSPANTVHAPSRGNVKLEAYVCLNNYLNVPAPAGQNRVVIEVPVYESSSAKQNFVVGHLSVCLKVRARNAVPNLSSLSPKGGLVEVLSMAKVTNGKMIDLVQSDQCPNEKSLISSQEGNSHRAMPPVGILLSTEWIVRHAKKRQVDAEGIVSRYKAYARANITPGDDLSLPSHERKCPSNFRPSSSKMEPLLAGLPFNTHVQSLVVEQLDGTSSKEDSNYWYNVTCGAAADHFRGFAPTASKLGGAGGARRLEAKRKELAKAADHSRTELARGINNYLQQNFVGNSRSTHIPTNNQYLNFLRSTCIGAEQSLADLTWELALRKANIFSQILGVAVTSYLAAISDTTKATAEATSRWARYGFLICFEGMLSAAGKEHGMIEDASKAVDMLKMVRVQILDASVVPVIEKGDGRVKVEGSRVLQWIETDWDVVEDGVTGLLVRIALDSAFYGNRVPSSLRNGKVSLYPLLFQMGVDIRQSMANAQSKIGTQLADKSGSATSGGIYSSTHSRESISNGDSENGHSDVRSPESDDEVLNDGEDGVPDNDFLVTLNFEAFRGLNHYANVAYPTGDRGKTHLEPCPGGGPIHPFLGVLWNNIRDSSQKMEHGVLDAAAAATERLGGSGVIFCKSGKDRTAMQATLKQAQFLGICCHNGDNEALLADATLMRKHGTRLAVCEKNVGQPKFAFNSLQVKFMPDILKPPLSSVAGFLKGGRIFSGGGIET